MMSPRYDEFGCGFRRALARQRPLTSCSTPRTAMAQGRQICRCLMSRLTAATIAAFEGAPPIPGVEDAEGVGEPAGVGDAPDEDQAARDSGTTNRSAMPTPSISALDCMHPPTSFGLTHRA